MPSFMDYAPNYTGRVLLSYSTAGRTHTTVHRFARGGDVTAAAALASKLVAFLNAIKTKRYNDWTVLNWAFCLSDSDVFLPLTGVAAPDAGSGGTPDAGVKANGSRAVSWIGRSSGGQKHKFFLYGYAVGVESGDGVDFKVTSAEDSVVAAGYTALSELAPAHRASDNLNVSWYNYVNVKHNDYWVKRIRRGA